MKGKSQKLKTVGPALGDEELRQWLQQYMEKNPHLTTWVLSQQEHTGISRTALDDILEGIYFLPIESGGKGVSPKRSDIEKRIRAYREKVEGVTSDNGSIGFMNTVAYQRLCAAWDLAVNEKVITVAYSNPGDGKTFPLQKLLIQRMTSRPISILCSRNITVRYFAQLLAKAVDISKHHIIPELEDMVAEKLTKSPRGIVVDQANYLTERSLGTVCHIWERARVPIMLVGTQDLYDLFTTSDMTQDVRAQLTSRVAMHCPLSKLTLTEAKTLLKRVMGQDATDANVAKILEVTGGSFRSMKFIIPQIQRLKAMPKNAEELKGGKKTMEDIIVAAGSRLMAA